MILSPTGDAKPFSSEADGVVLGEGIGMAVLKRLEDAVRDRDNIYAVIKSMGTSSDGKSQSIYAPRAEGQAQALRTAYENAGIDPSTIELVEAHGTGTRVGDQVEFKALKEVFQSSSAGSGNWCASIRYWKSTRAGKHRFPGMDPLKFSLFPQIPEENSPNPSGTCKKN